MNRQNMSSPGKSIMILSHCISRMDQGKQFSSKWIMNELGLTREELTTSMLEIQRTVNPIFIRKISSVKRLDSNRNF